MEYGIAFCVSCRIALGKLRRVTNIAGALKNQQPNVTLTLLANSGPKGVLQSLKKEEAALFDHIEYAVATEMTDRLQSMNVDVVVVDTMSPRNLHQVDASLCLILREVLPDELGKFRLKQDRPWDLMILPHPQGHWMPDHDVIRAGRIEAVGWIYRKPDAVPEEQKKSENEQPMILITTGGGSGEDRGNDIRSDIAYLIASVRQKLPIPVKVVEVVGPRDWKNKSITGVDETLRPGPELHNVLSKANLVISAAGYNTVLELACTDVPVLLVPVPRYTDDQEKRAQLWGERLGMRYAPNQKELSVLWMAKILETRPRRPVVDIGPSGADRAAALILELPKKRYEQKPKIEFRH